MLSYSRSRPPMLMVMSSRLSTAVKSYLVNWLPWLPLNTSGLPCSRKASCRQSTQNSASKLLLMRLSVLDLKARRAGGVQILDALACVLN